MTGTDILALVLLLAVLLTPQERKPAPTPVDWGKPWDTGTAFGLSSEQDSVEGQTDDLVAATTGQGAA